MRDPCFSESSGPPLGRDVRDPLAALGMTAGTNDSSRADDGYASRWSVTRTRQSRADRQAFTVS